MWRGGEEVVTTSNLYKKFSEKPFSDRRSNHPFIYSFINLVALAERLGSDPNSVNRTICLAGSPVSSTVALSNNYWSTMSTNMRTRWTLLLCVCINQNTNGTFIVVSQLTADCGRFYTAKVACYSLSDNFMKYLLRNSVFPIFILTAYLYFADLVQTFCICINKGW